MFGHKRSHRGRRMVVISTADGNWWAYISQDAFADIREWHQVMSGPSQLVAIPGGPTVRSSYIVGTRVTTVGFNYGGLGPVPGSTVTH